MRPSLLSLAFLLAAALSACTIPVDTSPDTFKVEPVALSHLSGVKGVALENAYKVDAPQGIRVGEHTWVLQQKQLTDTAIVMLQRALEQQGLGAAPEAGKTVALRVHSPRASMRILPFFAQTFASVALDAEFGDGTKTTVYADNQSPMSGQRAFEGAILFSLNKLLLDEKFVAYLKR
jgi:hypothetical protein